MQSHTRIHKLALLAMFAALALGIYGLESFIPNPFPIPGIKLGLANIITLVVLKKYGIKDAGLVLIVRVILSALLFGQLLSLAYSLAGAVLCLLGEYLLNKFLNGKAIFLTAIVGALLHNAGQLGLAIIITQTPGVVVYAPYLSLAAILTGLFTGLCAHFTLKLLPKLEKANM